MQLVAIVQQQGLVNARLEIEMPPEDAAAEDAGDDDAVAGPGSAAAQRPARGQLCPSSVMLSTSGPSQALVSPPAMATS